MKIRNFGVEIWMNRYETTCEWNLAETCVESLTVEELLDMAGKKETILSELLPMKLTYGAIEGSERLRNLVAGLYEKQAVENVVITHGAIGANALVTEGKEFPDNSLIVGSPARAIRTLDDKGVEGLKRSAASYIANWRRFAGGLKRIDESIIRPE